MYFSAVGVEALYNAGTVRLSLSLHMAPARYKVRNFFNLIFLSMRTLRRSYIEKRFAPISYGASDKHLVANGKRDKVIKIDGFLETLRFSIRIVGFDLEFLKRKSGKMFPDINSRSN